MTNGLFEEAIADAKKIREVAEENAKKAILEAVTPKIRDFIESQILEQDSNFDDSLNEEKDLKSTQEDTEDFPSSIDETVELDESAISALLKLIGEESSAIKNGSRDVMALALSEAVSRLSASEQRKLYNMTQKIDERVENLNSRDLYNNKENNMTSREKYYEVDLEALREALNEDYDNPMGEMGGTMYEGEHEDEEEEGDLDLPDMPDEGDPADDLVGDAEGDMIPREEVERQIAELIADLDLDLEGDAAGDEPPPLDLGEEGPEALEEVFEIDPAMLRSELRRIRANLSEGELGLAGEKGLSKDMEHHFGGKGHKNAGKGGQFGGGKPGKDVLAEFKNTLRNQRRQNGALQNKLTKYRSAVQTLREQLEELNLFNAKLLYVNKLLQNKNINESQKRSIVQALDEAKDLREAKVLYKSLTESFSSGSRSSKNTLNESIRMGASSRTTKSGSSVSNSASGEVDRWAKLVGLKR